MFVDLQIRIEPSPDKNLPDASSLQVRIMYEQGTESEQDNEGNSAAQVVRLNSEARATATIQSVEIDKPVSAILENRQGLELSDLGEVETSHARDNEPVFLVLDSVLIKQSLKRDLPPKQPVFERSGYFINVGDSDQRLEGYSLSVDLVDSGAKEAVLRSLLAIEGDLRPVSATVEMSASVVDQLGTFDFSGADLKFDGGFEVSRPFNGDAAGWVWFLNGPRLFIGYRSDPPLAKARSDLRIMLPWQEETEGSASEGAESTNTRTPLDVDEENILNEPELFSDDPGSFCRPFSNPARILGERRFHTIFRVEQPEIEATSPTKPDYSVLSLKDEALESDFSRVSLSTKSVEFDKKAYSAAGLSKLTRSGFGRFLSGGLKDKLMPPMSAIDFMPLPKARWFSRREPVGASNPIDWDGDSSRYQALSVAGGHIMEWRVQWRSNGYSLGDVAHTLTLAPRQTRRIVKLDWERRERSGRRERTTFQEEVSQTTQRSRDYNDAVRSNLNEWSKGGSSSKTSGASGGVGFAMPGFVIGGGAAHGRAQSSSWSEGGRTVSASEEQSLRDAIRQFGDSVRQYESTVVTEVSQDETVEGVSEVVRNPNYCHSLTIIYHEILRHLRVDTVLAGVRECLFVPFSVRPFSRERVARWRGVLERHLKKPELRWALKYADDVAAGWEDSQLPDKPRMAQPLEKLAGSLYIKLGIERPKDEMVSDEIDEQMDAEGTVGERVTTKVWQYFAPLLPLAVGQIVSRMREFSPAQRDAYFQREIAPAMARRWIDQLTMETKDGPLAGADFTLATNYGFNKTVRVDFYVPVDQPLQDGDEGLTREKIRELIVKAGSSLPLGSVANLVSATLDFRTSHYGRRLNSGRRLDDLISPPERQTDDYHATPNTEDARVFFPTSEWEERNMRTEAEQALDKIVGHINEDLHHYHKIIWWTMDRDELYMLIDGFAVSDSDRRSIASVVEREPVAIVGNALVFRVAAGAFLGINGHETPADMVDYYRSQQMQTQPMRVSLPTDGLYAQAIMDQCNACEEHEGSTDWVLNDKDPALAEFPGGLFESRREAPQGTTPTSFPDSIINLQNAPAAPTPQGYGEMFGVLGSNSGFRDMAGLAGTQQNARASMEHASKLAEQFGGFALQSKLAELEADKNAGKNFDKKRAAVDRAVAKKSISKEDGEATLRAAAEDMGRQKARGVSDKAKDIIDRFGQTRDVTIDETTPHGHTSTSIKASPAEAGSDPETGADKEVVQPGKAIVTDKLVKDSWHHGMWNERILNWDVLLYDFEVDEAKLLPHHEQILDTVLEIIDTPQSLTSYYGELHTFSPIVGRASQTGPEQNNRALSEERADAVEAYLDGHSREMWGKPSIFERHSRIFPSGSPKTIGLGSDSPLEDLPGEESAENRSAVFEFSMSRIYLNMYTRDDADRWLKEWLTGAGSASSEEEQLILRRKAKGWYLLARNYIDMVEKGHRTPPVGEPAYHVLTEWKEETGASEPSAKASITSAYAIAKGKAAAAMSAAYSLEGDTMDRQQVQEHLRKSRLDPYFRYTYGPVKRIVDGEERWVSVREYVEQANNAEREIYGNVTTWIDDKWMSE